MTAPTSEQIIRWSKVVVAVGVLVGAAFATARWLNRAEVALDAPANLRSEMRAIGTEVEQHHDSIEGLKEGQQEIDGDLHGIADQLEEVLSNQRDYQDSALVRRARTDALAECRSDPTRC